MEDKGAILEKIAITNMYQFEALVNLLERKGLIASKEVMEELEVLIAEKRKKRLN